MTAFTDKELALIRYWFNQGEVNSYDFHPDCQPGKEYEGACSMDNWRNHRGLEHLFAHFGLSPKEAEEFVRKING